MRILRPVGPFAAALSLLALAFSLTMGATRPAGAENKGTSVTVTDGKSLKKTIEGLKGKVVVVNLWATWCAPCVEEFPDLVKLQNTYRDRDVVVVGVSVDDPDQKAAVVSFLAGQKADFPVYVRGKGSIDDFINPLDRGWAGVVPTTYVYDKSGKRAGKAITGKRTYQQFQAAVEPLLK